MAIDGLHVVTAPKAKGGRLYVYAWRGGPRLFARPGTPEFFAEYNAAVGARAALPGADVLAGLILEFKASRAFRSLAPATRADYRRYFPSIEAEFGAAPLRAFEAPAMRGDIRRWHDRFRRPREADKALGCLSRLLSFARDDGLIAHNPALDIPKRYVRRLDPTPWTAAELERYIAGDAERGVGPAPAHLARIAELAPLTGFARADLAAVGRPHVQANKIVKPRAKSKRAGRPQIARVFIDDALRAFLDAVPAGQLMLLVDAGGRPWRRADALGKAFDARRRALGIEKTLHDIRATYACRLYARGASDEDVADSLGWSLATVRQIRRHYVDDETIFEGRVARLGEPAGTK